eukprot:1136295-Pelagomonas_calceolata.AAC.5
MKRVLPPALHHDAKCQTPEYTLPCSHMMFREAENSTTPKMVQRTKMAQEVWVASVHKELVHLKRKEMDREG